ncbi:MAG: hypothetical protein RBU25_08755, partial [Lentisphaeria bacterium]|nr:hypothetical protein [Lentisphaeria bacterium]
TLRLRTGDGETAVRLDAAAEAVLPHQPRGNWVYLGQGYRHGGPEPGSVFAVELGSVRSRVRR